MLSLVLLSVLARQEPVTAKTWSFGVKGEEKPRLFLRVDSKQLDPPKKSPKHAWQFNYIAAGLGAAKGSDGTAKLRFRVYSQFQRESNDPAFLAGKMLMRLWDWNTARLRIDHPESTGYLVDFYLCFGGQAGGEQLLDREERGARTFPVNTCYIYDVTSFTEPVEMAREVAHEYGHAVLPPVSGFEQPETWANGFLGEKIYLQWAYDAMTRSDLGADSFMNASPEAVRTYLEKNAWPLRDNVRDHGPNWRKLREKDATAMDAFIGNALYAQQILPEKAFARSLSLNAELTGPGYAKAVVSAAGELDSWVVPTEVGKAVWLPVGSSRVVGGRVLDGQAGWSKVLPSGTSITIKRTAR